MALGYHKTRHSRRLGVERLKSRVRGRPRFVAWAARRARARAHAIITIRPKTGAENEGFGDRRTRAPGAETEKRGTWAHALGSQRADAMLIW